MKRSIPYGRQDVDKDDVSAVVEVLRSDWLTQGPAIQRFESAIMAHTDARHAVAFCNATAALHIACRALDLGPGDLLWTVPNTFVASANCALYCGAQVDFVDIDARTYCMSLSALRAKLELARTTGKLPKVVIPVHFAGQPCEMDEIRALSREYGFAVIEDASHAVGADYKQQRVGNGKTSEITIFSFHPVKIVTTGEGGMALTNRADLAEKMRLLRTHGITRDPAVLVDRTQGAWYYEQVELGCNYRMTDIQAALGASQLNRLTQFVAQRRALAKRYDEKLKKLPLTLPFQASHGESAWHLYVVQVSEGSKKDRAEVFASLRENGVLANVHYIPVHLQPYYRKLGFAPGEFPVAEAYYQRTISLPMYATLSTDDQDYVIEKLEEVLCSG